MIEVSSESSFLLFNDFVPILNAFFAIRVVTGKAVHFMCYFMFPVEIVFYFQLSERRRKQRKNREGGMEREWNTREWKKHFLSPKS